MKPVARAALAAWLLCATTALGDRTTTRSAAQLGSGPVAVDRGDAARSGATTTLPSSPKEVLRLSVGARLASGAIARGGKIYAAAQRELTVIDVTTSKAAKADMGAPAAHAVAVDAAGRIWSLLTSGEVVVFDADLRVVSRRSVPGKESKLRAAPVLVDGTWVVAAGTTLMRVDADGRELASVTLPEAPALALAAYDGVVFATSDLGHVFTWDGVAPPREIERLGGVPSSALSVTKDGPVAIVEGARMVRLKSGAPTWTTLLRGGGSLLEGPVALSPTGQATVETTGGQLVTVGLDGQELRRLDLPSPRAGMHVESIGGLGPGPLVDDAGKVAFVRATGEVGVADKDVIQLADKLACRDPIGLSASAGLLVVSCVDGSIVGYR